MKLLKASAVVDVQLRVSLGPAWGAECQMEQVYRQAAREAIETIQRAMSGGIGARQITIIGEPKVKTIITEDQ